MRVEIPVIGVESRSAARFDIRKVAVWHARVNSAARNMGMEIAVVAVNNRGLSVLAGATGIWIKMGSPLMRPLAAIPRIVTISMFIMSDAMVPMVIDIDVIEADVIVVIMVAPSPTVWPPPGLRPDSEPGSVAESKAKAHVPIVRKARAVREQAEAKLALLQTQVAPLQQEINQLGRQFWVSKDQVKANNYDLSASRYRQVEQDDVYYEKPEVTIARLRELEQAGSTEMQQILSVIETT